MLALIDKETKFNEQKRTIIKTELGDMETKMKAIGVKVSSGLEEAHKEHKNASVSVKNMEQALISSQQTQIISGKLKQLEELKKMN